MISEINAAIKQNDFQRVKVLVEAVIEEVSYQFSALWLYLRVLHTIMFVFLITAHKYV
jgi:hypothetical protein